MRYRVLKITLNILFCIVASVVLAEKLEESQAGSSTASSELMPPDVNAVVIPVLETERYDYNQSCMVLISQVRDQTNTAHGLWVTYYEAAQAGRVVRQEIPSLYCMSSGLVSDCGYYSREESYSVNGMLVSSSFTDADGCTTTIEFNNQLGLQTATRGTYGQYCPFGATTVELPVVVCSLFPE